MEPISILIALAAAGTLGFGGFSSFLAFKALKSLPQTEDNSAPENKTKAEKFSESGGARRSNLLSPFPDGIFRMRNGGYFTTYLFEPSLTLYSDADAVDRIYDDLGSMLGADVPVGTGFQFRQSVFRDNGDLIEEQGIGLLTKPDCHPIAQSLKYRQIKFLADRADAGQFKKSNFSLSVYLPVKHDQDHLNNPITLTLREVRKNGFSKKALKSGFESESDLTKRLLAAEEKSFSEAQTHLRTIENNAPLKLNRLSTAELWDHLYRSHNLNATSSPPLPSDQLADVGELLWQETIQFRGNSYALHGNRPVARISMIVPPESDERNNGCFAGVMRLIGNHPINFGDYTIVTEFIKEDREKSIKSLQSDLWRLERFGSSATSGQTEFKDPNKKKQWQELKQVIDQSTNAGGEIIKMRQYLVVYGEPAETSEELKTSVKMLDDNCGKLIALLRKTMRGADFVREEPYAIRSLYQSTILGEMELSPQGREIREQASSLSVFAPIEYGFTGMPNSHTIVTTTTGRLLGFNLISNSYMNATGVLIIGATRSGKSNFNSLILNDFFALIPEARVCAVDYGGSLAPLAEVCEGRIYNFKPNVRRPINIWDYSGLERGTMPDSEQVNLVLQAYAILLDIDEKSEIGKDQRSVLLKAVKEVYKEIIPHNELNKRRIEPRLANLVRSLQTRHYESKGEYAIGEQIAGRLSGFIGDPWLDAETHESYHRPSRFDVYEVLGLSDFDKDTKRYLSFTIGARVRNAVTATVDGKFTPTLTVFEECNSLIDDPDLKNVILAAQMCSKHGGKNFTIPLYVSHTYSSVAQFPDITENLGAIFIGSQDNLKQLMQDRGLNQEVERSVRQIRNQKGSHSQFVLVFGKGDNQIVQPVTVFLSSIELWMFTTDPNERNARAVMKKYFPHWSLAQHLLCLSGHYERGLTFYGKTEIDQAILDGLIEREKDVNPKYRKFLKNLESGKIIENEILLDDADIEELSEELKDAVDEIFSNHSQIPEELKDLGINIPGAIIADGGRHKI